MVHGFTNDYAFILEVRIGLGTGMSVKAKQFSVVSEYS